MHGRLGAIAVVCASVAVPATAAAASKTVYAGGGPVKFQTQLGQSTGGGVNNFMINRVTINVGDTVVWDGKALANGFHSVDFPKKGGKPLPAILPTGKQVTGVLDAAGNPFWFNNLVPQLGFNPQLLAASGGKTYNGSKAVDSGLPLGKPKDFKLKFTKAGTYKYYCNVHPGMVGFVVVKPKGQKVPTAKQDAATLTAAEKAYVTEAKGLDQTKPGGNNVSVGASGAGGLEVFAMFPGKLTIKTGTTVTFSMSKLSRELHTATFGPKGYVTALANALASQPVVPGNSLYPSDPPAAITLSPTSHGNGFANVGALDRDSATAQIQPSGKITFTAPGTYHFICLVHPFMHGTVVVTP
jgi:plastocyanin